MAINKSAGQSTILQVAAHAGLSIATVSRVLNGGRYVAEATRERVLKAARELDYQPNYMARQLHGQDAFAVAVVLGMELGTISPFALTVYEAVKVALQRVGYRVKRARFSADGKLLTAAKAYVGIGLHHNDPRYEQVVNQSGCPYISIGDAREGHFWVASNDQHGGYLATQHLIDNGCRAIYYACLHNNHEVSRSRYQGYRKALLNARLIPAEAIEIVTDTGLPALDSYRRIRELLESGLRPDAFVAFSDIVATGISMALADTGKRVPEDVQVVGYDGIDDDRYHSLTTVKQDVENLAIQATELIIAAIRHEQPRGCFLDVLLRGGQTTRLIETVQG